MQEDRPEPIDHKLVRALAHPARIQILEILSERVASPNMIAAELETGLSHVAYHTRALDRCGCLELVQTAQRRGATEHFYKARPRVFIGDQTWRSVPASIRGGVSAASLQTFMDKAVAALEAGTMDEREDTTLSWMPLHLDDRGWEEVTQILRGATDRVVEAQEESNRRARSSRQDERSISAVVALALFETGTAKPGEKNG
jgi:DNA-binding transcriptional ArsR family regulator